MGKLTGDLTVKKPKYDVIGYWSEVKLDIIRSYATEYSKILNSKKRHIRKHIYVDAFGGSWSAYI